MRQFDVIVWGERLNAGGNSDARAPEPYFTDPALGWFFGNDLNASLEKTDAEWIVFAHESVKIDRNFLNDLAQAIEGYPMVDAFAPRVKSGDRFFGGYLLDGKRGLSPLDEKAKMQFVAAPQPLIAAYSRRIVQRTGRVDDELPLRETLVDYSLRMYHAGGKMFSLPFLVAELNGQAAETASEKTALADTAPAIAGDFRTTAAGFNPVPLAKALYKNLGFIKIIPFLLTHAATWFPLWKERKSLDAKRDAATLLSKLGKDTLKDISRKG